ncbi:uracil-DNA glycosylase [Paraburkholderia sp. BL8N3]|nr:uracil-DNA glycosylase family protein [Paraburkholderia sp. BL8N3]TCK33488.1 uracil-DNA glycosylase [Paraburkholderia sp. BL8N3]
MSTERETRVQRLLTEIRACQVCQKDLPLGPRPLLQFASDSRILIVGQAPGMKAHLSGVPWADASGERLRDWLGIGPSTFYDASMFAIVPMGFCYPGRGRGGDNPPRPECAPLWLDEILNQLANIQLTLLIGSYAQARFLGRTRRLSLTETVAAWREYAPRFIPLPHPSPRNQAWFKRHGWFHTDIVPVIRERVAASLYAKNRSKPRPA